MNLPDEFYSPGKKIEFELRQMMLEIRLAFILQTFQAVALAILLGWVVWRDLHHDKFEKSFEQLVNQDISHEELINMFKLSLEGRESDKAESR